MRLDWPIRWQKGCPWESPASPAGRCRFQPAAFRLLRQARWRGLWICGQAYRSQHPNAGQPSGLSANEYRANSDRTEDNRETGFPWDDHRGRRQKRSFRKRLCFPEESTKRCGSCMFVYISGKELEFIRRLFFISTRAQKFSDPLFSVTDEARAEPSAWRSWYTRTMTEAVMGENPEASIFKCENGLARSEVGGLCGAKSATNARLTRKNFQNNRALLDEALEQALYDLEIKLEKTYTIFRLWRFVM